MALSRELEDSDITGLMAKTGTFVPLHMIKGVEF
jgi:hypothetical protein